MTGAQLALEARPLHKAQQTPETALKGTEKEFQAKLPGIRQGSSQHGRERQQEGRTPRRHRRLTSDCQTVSPPPSLIRDSGRNDPVMMPQLCHTLRLDNQRGRPLAILTSRPSS
ncbi:hypothetical protein Q5P01_015122 [Channa striata]|uniref:Uncharacterized protein n=1 Tax=Channa striata TaxID=64152 RepID=A0AA88MGQ9_CHASR|nr:hypothetical protein Q5P01_015122 [Channa striata]